MTNLRDDRIFTRYHLLDDSVILTQTRVRGIYIFGFYVGFWRMKPRRMPNSSCDPQGPCEHMTIEIDESFFGGREGNKHER